MPHACRPRGPRAFARRPALYDPFGPLIRCSGPAEATDPSIFRAPRELAPEDPSSDPGAERRASRSALGGPAQGARSGEASGLPLPSMKADGRRLALAVGLLGGSTALAGAAASVALVLLAAWFLGAPQSGPVLTMLATGW